MTDSLEREVRELRSFYWSERDPEGRGFAPLADAYRRSGDLEGARELLAEGLERHPGFASGHVVAARVHLAEGDKDAAVHALNRVLELDDENTEALWTLGSLHEEKGDSASAFDLFKRLAVLVPDDDEVLDRIAALESQLESGDGRGLSVESEVDTVGLDSVETDEAPGDLAVAPHSDELAESSWEFATPDLPESEAPDDQELYTRTLAELYADQGLFDRAAEVYRHLLAADPDDADLRARLEAVEGRILPAAPVGAESVDEPVDDTDLDEIAAELATGPAVAGDLDTPFAWSEAEPLPEPEEGPPIADHFTDLLSWPAPDVAHPGDQEVGVPGDRPAEAEVPGSEPVPIDSLAPEGSSPTTEAPAVEEPVPVAFLAPDVPPQEVVPIDALAPEDTAAAEDEEVSDQVAKFRDWMRRLGK